MREFSEPDLTIFFDNNVWMALFGVGNERNTEQAKQRRLDIIQYMQSVRMGAAGIVFSPCLLADASILMPLQKFKEDIAVLEEAGYVSILEPTADWTPIAKLRETIRDDVKANPAAFSHLTDQNKRRTGLGDTAAIYAALKSGADELWTYDGLMLALSERRCVRNLKICEPHPLELQGKLF